MSKLGEIFTLQRGKTYKSRLLGEPGPVLLGLATIARDGGFRHDNLKTYGGDSPEALIVRPGELYVSLKDVTQSGDLLGSVARLPDFVGIGRLTQDTVKLEPRSGCPPLDYVYWLLRTPQYRAHCRGHATGTTNLGLAREDFLAFEVPPLTPERKLLTRVLESLEQKIEQNRRTGSKLEDLARAVFKAWFVDFEPVKAKAAGATAFPGMPPETFAALLTGFTDSALGPIPEGWKVKVLEEVVEAVKGLSYKGAGLVPADAADKSDVLPLHNLNSVYEGGGYKNEGIKRYRGEYKDRHVIYPGDLIVTNTEQGHQYRLIGFPAIVPNRFGERGLFSHHIFRVRPLPKSPLRVHFLFHAIMSGRIRDEIVGCTNGTTVNMLSVDGLKRPRICVPSAAIAGAFEKQAAAMYELCESQRDESAKLAALRDYLLPRLLSGRVRVKEAERVVSNAS